MKGKQLDDLEAVALSGTEVAWFGSVEVPGGGEEVITASGRWWNPDELAVEPPASMGARELDRRAAGYN
jgi:hypothetical protein